MTDDSRLPALQITIEGPRLRADREGYFIDDEYVQGFADRHDLKLPDRQLIARWCQSFTPDVLTSEQRRLLERSEARLSTATQQLRDAAIENAERDMPLAADVGLYGRLAADEVRKVREPWIVLGEHPPRDYPLSAAELAELTGATTKQIRSWEESGLLPAYWIAERRHFFSAAAVHAFALRKLDRNEIRGARRVLSSDPEDPIPELVAAAVERSRYTATPARLTMLIAAKALAGPSALGSKRPPRRAISPGHSMSPRPVARFDTFCMTHVPADWSRLATRRSGMNLGPHVSVRDTPQEAFHTWSVQAQCPGTVLVTARDIETLAKRR
jgi:DNA-binding transcriptional MerR regulator